MPRLCLGTAEPLSAPEKQHLSEKDIKDGIRLACLTYITGDCEVRVDKAAEMTIELGAAESGAAVDPAFEKYGVAVDIGTTTLATALYDRTARGSRRRGVRIRRRDGART